MRRILYLCGCAFLFVVTPLPAGAEANSAAGTAEKGLKITATRQGRVLQLDCHLGPGLQAYSRNRQNPPQFTVRKNGEEVGSGTFEYG